MSKCYETCVVPFFGQGHILPCLELCKHLASRNFSVTLIISSSIAHSIPSSFRQHSLLRIAQIPSPPSPPPPHHGQLAQGLQNILSDQARPVCAIIDVMMSWSTHVFAKFQVPTVAFFTSGASSAAMELATWKAHPLHLKPGEICLLHELPQDMALTYSDLKRRPHDPPPPFGGGPPHHGGGAGFPPPPGGPPKLGDPPRWMEEVRDAVALMINTCDDLERPFIDYIASHIGKPVWGVGPLLPEQYWKSIDSLVHDRDGRSNRQSSVSEEEVIQWLDSKPRGSVLYVSFGSEVGPTMEEYQELAQAVESCEDLQFIWVLQTGSVRPGPPRMILGEESGPEVKEGYFPHGLDSIVGNRGLIIRGWAPQLLILSHPSTGGFLSHCGWNSTVEAIGRGIPFLAWPIRGDQYYDAKLVVSHLKVGYMITHDLSRKVTKDDIVKGIKNLLSDKEIKKTAEILSVKFQNGFPTSSVAALDDFKHYVNQRFV
ncbi:hypothetical protein VNO77_40342 [Canavalia gladiata]|uniref:Glycosyltransferase n=1 Tax=Canavalia gladiata TaxID=3824 RepID=A0AAN9JXI7_CANGL